MIRSADSRNCRTLIPSEAIPDAEIAERIGDVSLIIKVSPFPLAPDLRGVDILSHRIWHETTLAEIDGRKFADRLFGEVDVPLLEDYHRTRFHV